MTLNGLLVAEANRLCGARKYERTEERKDTRAGSYNRHLQTRAGEVTLTVPKVGNLPFETAIIEHNSTPANKVRLPGSPAGGRSLRCKKGLSKCTWPV